MKIVDDELKIEVSEDIKAANITANMRPLNPAGNNSLTNLTKARFVQPYLKENIETGSVGNLKIKLFRYLKKIIPKLNCSQLNYLDPHVARHSSGLAHATSLGNRALAAIPGNTMIHKGSNFK